MGLVLIPVVVVLQGEASVNTVNPVVICERNDLGEWATHFAFAVHRKIQCADRLRKRVDSCPTMAGLKRLE